MAESVREPARPPRAGAVQAWTAEGFEQALATPGSDPTGAAGLLESLFALETRAHLRAVPGRETFRWPGREHLVVKRFTGGEARDYWHDRVRGVARSAARREVEVLAALAAEGFDVPRPLAWAEEERARRHPRRAGRSALVMEWVPHGTSLRALLASADPARRRALGARLLELVGSLHRSGWIHRDLYLHHVVPRARTAADEASLVLLDVARARRGALGVRSRWYVKDLASLAFSAPAAVTRAERLRFLRGWLRATGRADEPRRWWRRVGARAARLAAHRPRHLDPADPVDAELFGTDPARPGAAR